MSVANVVKRVQGDLALDSTAGQAALDVQAAMTDHVIGCFKATADAMAADASTLLAFKAPYAMRIVAFDVIPNTTLTANDTNNAVFTVAKADGLGGAAVVCATLTTNVASGSWAADTLKAGTVSTVAGAASVAAGQIVTLKLTKGGSGVVVPISSYTIRVRSI